MFKKQALRLDNHVHLKITQGIYNFEFCRVPQMPELQSFSFSKEMK